MKIGIIAHNAHPISQPYQGGLEMITYLIVEELAKRGHHVTTLCLKGSHLNCEMLHYEAFEHGDVENVCLREFGNFHNALSEFIKVEFDVIHNHSLSHYAIVFGNIIETPFLTSFHTPVFSNLNVAIRSVSRNVNQTFTAVSKSLAKTYQEFLPEVNVVYNGIDLKQWSLIEKKEDYYSWCGRICKEKGLKEILDLCDKYRLELKIIGPISNEDYYNDEIKPRLQKYTTCDYLGHLDQSQVNNVIGQSRAFIFSSTWEEPYGLVIAEALASGTPVVANTIGAVSEILTDKCGVLFNLNDENSFLAAIAGVEKLGPEDCRLRAALFCSHHKMVDDYERLYEYAIGQKFAVI